MAGKQTIEVPIQGMDCADCTRHVQEALAKLPGVDSVDVLLSTEKAVLTLDPERVKMPQIRAAVAEAGYTVLQATGVDEPQSSSAGLRFGEFTAPVLTLFGLVFGAVLFIVVAGEWLGLFERISERLPWYAGLAVVLLGGYPVFLSVIRAALKGKVISHTLMTVGVLAAIAVGEWATAAVVVFFMRVGDYAERFTTERARQAVKDLQSLAPKTARVERQGVERLIPIGEVQPGETVVVRPGETIPVDGVVIDGQATIDQATITGESLPVEAGPGAKVYAATLARLGSLRLRVLGVGRDTTFGRVIKLVEEAETQRADVQRVADKFSAYYLPVVAGVALLTFLLRRDPLATAAVLVVACSCSFALATPIAVLASIGAAARRGLMIKGGKYLETLSQADVLLVDKTGTLTLGKPQITDVVALNGVGEEHLIALAASAERYSEHPLAEAVRNLSQERGLQMAKVEGFVVLPGKGVQAEIDGRRVMVGNRQFVAALQPGELGRDLESQGKTLMFVVQDGALAGVLAAADTLRLEVPAALRQVRELGIRQIELLTGDNQRTAAELAGKLGVSFRSNLLPEDKIRIVKEYQSQGHRVVMIGDGINDAPALAQADVGIAMGAAGTDVAIEAAHIALMRQDWSLVPDALRIARRSMRVIKMNIGFTVLYNFVGLSLAALGFLPPVLAAAAQSLPDLGILANSSRLLRQK